MTKPKQMREALHAIAVLHRPESGMGFTGNQYGSINPACTTCGTTDEYAVPWPCATLREVLKGLGEPIPDAAPVDIR